MTTMTLDPFTATPTVALAPAAPPAADGRDWKYTFYPQPQAIYVRVLDKDVHRCVGYAIPSPIRGLVEIRIRTGPDKGRYTVAGWEYAKARLEQLTRRCQ